MRDKLSFRIGPPQLIDRLSLEMADEENETIQIQVKSQNELEPIIFLWGKTMESLVTLTLKIIGSSSFWLLTWIFIVSFSSSAISRDNRSISCGGPMRKESLSLTQFSAWEQHQNPHPHNLRTVFYRIMVIRKMREERVEEIR